MPMIHAKVGRFRRFYLTDAFLLFYARQSDRSRFKGQRRGRKTVADRGTWGFRSGLAGAAEATPSLLSFFGARTRR